MRALMLRQVWARRRFGDYRRLAIRDPLSELAVTERLWSSATAL
jgi:hypothetical protein